MGEIIFCFRDCLAEAGHSDSGAFKITTCDLEDRARIDRFPDDFLLSSLGVQFTADGTFNCTVYIDSVNFGPSQLGRGREAARACDGARLAAGFLFGAIESISCFKAENTI